MIFFCYDGSETLQLSEREIKGKGNHDRNGIKKHNPRVTTRTRK